MITKNFRLNALANKYASALYNHITSTSGGDYFMVDADGEAVRVEIVNGVKGVRSLIDSYTLAAMKVFYWPSRIARSTRFNKERTDSQ